MKLFPGRVESYLNDVRSSLPRSIQAVIVFGSLHLGFHGAGVLVALVFTPGSREPLIGALHAGFVLVCVAFIGGLIRRKKWGWWMATIVCGLPTVVSLGGILLMGSASAILWGFLLVLFGVPTALLLVGRRKYISMLPSNQPPKLWGRVVVVAAVSSLIMIITPFSMAFVVIKLARMTYTNRSELSRHWDHYEAIVQAISGMNLEPGRVRAFSVAANRDPSTLSPLSSQQYESMAFILYKEGRCIEACRNSDGRLKVTFVTQDLGHLALYSLVYVDPPPPQQQWRDIFGLHVNPHPVAPGWWSIEDFSR